MKNLNKSVHVKAKLLSLINNMSLNIKQFVKNPDRDFTRNRKLTFSNTILFLISMGGNSLQKELFDFHKFADNTPTSVAFVQQRNKILPYALEKLFCEFSCSFEAKKFHDYRLLAIDGSDLHIPTNQNDTDSSFKHNETSKGYNLLHLNAIYDLCSKRYEDVLIQPRRQGNEHKALTCIIDRCDIGGKVIFVADRGYESYNNIAHIGTKGWNYVIRIKNSNGIISKLTLPDTDEFDMNVSVLLTRRQTNEVKSNPSDYRLLQSNSVFDYLKQGETGHYPLSFRVVRFRVSDNVYETVITNLRESEFSPQLLSKIYQMRWGIETSFRELKYSIGLLSFHSKKPEFILQEIYAKLIMYNFSMIIATSITVKQKDRKYGYQVNYVQAVRICACFLHGNTIMRDIEDLIVKSILPIRPGRKSKRKLRQIPMISFIYRIA